METDEAFEPPASGLVVALDSVAQHSGLLGATPSIAAVVVLAAVVVPCGTVGESTLPVATAPQFESAFTLVQFFVATFASCGILLLRVVRADRSILPGALGIRTRSGGGFFEA